MKKIYLLIFMCSVLGCSEHAEMESLQECKYIDYMTCPEESITPQDRFLLDHVDFQEGELVCSLNADAVAEQGISEQKYAYFLEYLQNENREIKADLDSGKIVVYNGKPFTRNEELYQYIEMPDPVQTKATEYMPPRLLKSIEMTMGFDRFPTTTCGFRGPAKISVIMRGLGKFELTERFKGLNVVLCSTEAISDAEFKWGITDDAPWSWNVTYKASAYQKGTLSFYGYYQKKKEESEEPSVGEGHNSWISYNLPSYIQIIRIKEETYSLRIKEPGSYTVRIYRIINQNNYILDNEVNGINSGEYTFYLSDRFSYWIAIYKERKIYDRVEFIYIGEILLSGRYDKYRII